MSNKAEDIISRVEKFTGKNLREKTRVREVVEARHISIYLIRNFTELTHQEIAGLFGHKDHTTSINACKNVDSLLRYDKDFIKKNEKFINSFKK